MVKSVMNVLCKKLFSLLGHAFILLQIINYHVYAIIEKYERRNHSKLTPIWL